MNNEYKDKTQCERVTSLANKMRIFGLSVEVLDNFTLISKDNNRSKLITVDENGKINEIVECDNIKHLKKYNYFLVKEKDEHMLININGVNLLDYKYKAVYGVTKDQYVVSLGRNNYTGVYNFKTKEVIIPYMFFSIQLFEMDG